MDRVTQTQIELLRGQGYAIDSVATAGAAATCLQTIPYSLVIADWVPIPGKIGRFVLMTPAFVSLASQLPMFGILTLCIRRSRLTIVFLVVPLAAIAIVPLSLARVQWSLIATLLGGPALIWFSYRYWCRAEIGASFG